MSKKTTRTAKKNRRQSVRRAHRRRWPWFIIGVAIGVGVPWLAYLDYLVKTAFIHHRWQTPSQVYAAPLNSYQGMTLSPERLQYHLRQLGYQSVKTKPDAPGQYRHWRTNTGHAWEIHTRGFRFAEGPQAPQQVRLRLEKATPDTPWQVESLQGANVLTLEPVRLGGFYSATGEQRQPVTLSQLPTTLIQGIQAVEDRQFKHHHGINLAGILRAAWHNLKAGKVVQGGSTITQQLVKNRLRTPQRSWRRKINEAMLAVLLEQHLDKGAILEDYLNEAYWGQNGKLAIHGIAEAVEYYFGTSPEQLDLAEQALLIGLVKGPSWYNPRKHPERALQRRNLVLRLMADTGIISESARTKAVKKPLGVTAIGHINTGLYSDFLQLVNQRLQQRFRPGQLQNAGLRIFTTLEPWAQHQLNETLARQVPKAGAGLQAAAVLTQAQSGEILALDGDARRISGFNRALLARRQIGSLIKPFIYLAGLELLPDFSLDSPLADEPVAVSTGQGTSWRPANFSRRSHGTAPAREALLHSWNLATVHLGLRIGLKPLADFLQHLGLQTPRQVHPSLFLGAIDLSPLEVTQLYQLLASRGSQNKTVALRAVTDTHGRPLLRMKPSKPPILKPEHLQQILRVLHQITFSGTAASLQKWPELQGPLFGKTGTTNGGRDNWFAGFNPRYLLTVWVGRDDNKPTGLTGAKAALPVWAESMLALQESR